MTDPVTRLQAALAERYRIERELGQGGMATVYLAEDLKHHRRVALKVLRPELAATLGPERFGREIAVAARLQHPHILGLIDSGEAGGFFYYVMPYVQGETLRDRLARGGELPVPEAVRLLGEIAEALATAHQGGVVHRDIKPENVMLSGRHAMVMDFGVAKAVTEASGEHQLTSAGVALGTPAYMAPEQASADPHMDARVDIYAVGVIAYEMLTGATPFPGLNPQQTLAAHVTRTPTPVGQQREGLSPGLDAVVMRCLAKRPADRFQTADELVTALEPLAGPSGGITPTQTRPIAAVAAKPSGMPRWAWAAGALVVVAVGAAAFIWKPWARAADRPLDANLVAVLPFRTAGADPSVQYLRQGMVDLMQAKLTGEVGPRAADARSVLAAVRDAGGGDADDLDEKAVAQVARKVGAGRVLQGSIVGPADHLVVNASLVSATDGRTLTQTSVTGPRDSLFVLIDRLTAQLLALGTGASADQLSALTTTSLDALRAYLDGVAAFRRGVFQASTPAFSRAVELDSTFALALSALVESDGWHPATTDMNRVRHLAWQYRERLNPRDQLFLSLRLGSRYPRTTPWQVQIADAERAVQRIPESAETWFYLGDALLHFGRVSDVADPEVRARQAFEQSFQRDSLYGAPIQHLAVLTWVSGDTAAQRLWTGRLIALDSTAEGVPGARWNLLQARRDTAGLRAFLSKLDSNPTSVAQGILFFEPLDSLTTVFQDQLFDAAYRLAATKAERIQVAADRVRALNNRGRPSQAARWIDTVATMSVRQAGFLGVIGMYWFGGGRADTTTMDSEQRDIWAAYGGDAARGARLLAFWKQKAAADSTDGFYLRGVPLLEARLATMRGDPAAARLTDRADSLWQGYSDAASWAGLELARLYEGQGRVDRALRAVRRRYSPLGEPESGGLAESYRMEGRLAALADDKVGALRAYQNYLRLRVDPEPSRVPQLDSVRAEIQALGGLEGTH
ncbi:MAG TPA: serine/threonine-protein kinase [Gemmatimonadales bacterium]|nr:serine/threonine-protein kinase [Gemmatimonadales bacterium]